MKLQTTVAALIIAALPIAAQASIASVKAGQINHEPLAQGAPNVAQIDNVEARDYRFAGSSAALAETQRNIIALGDQRTDFPTDQNETQIGHDADW
ncbi:MAG TPA: hypothetical protein VFM75_07165 [Modicisalibacter sp.]|nr:hypothetical protein [Modicisalibacter sp.]